MSLLELLMLSTALGADLFSVAIPIGMNKVRRLLILRAAFVFALFHIVMLLAGYHAGHWLGGVVEHVGTYHIDWPAAAVQNWATILGALVLTFLGIRMIRDYYSEDVAPECFSRPLCGFALIMVATSVSIDALAAGFSLGMMDVDLLKLSLILGLVIFIIALAGLGLGRRIGRIIGSRAGIIGGGVLVVLGLHVLWSVLS